MSWSVINNYIYENENKYRAINENVQDIFYFMYISTVTS